MNFPTTASNIPQTSAAWHNLTREQSLELLQSNGELGLSSSQIAQRQAYFGSNELKETGGRSTLTILWEQFTNIMLVMLIAVAIVSAVLDLRQNNFPKDAVAIGAIRNFKWNSGIFTRKSG